MYADIWRKYFCGEFYRLNSIEVENVGMWYTQISQTHLGTIIMVNSLIGLQEDGLNHYKNDLPARLLHTKVKLT